MSFIKIDGSAKRGGLSEKTVPWGAFEIGSRTIYEVLPYDDKIIFVLVDGRAYDILTFVCGENGIEKTSETIQPDDLEITPQYPKGSSANENQ